MNKNIQQKYFQLIYSLKNYLIVATSAFFFGFSVTILFILVPALSAFLSIIFSDSIITYYVPFVFSVLYYTGVLLDDGRLNRRTGIVYLSYLVVAMIFYTLGFSVIFGLDFNSGFGI
jgi:hypothetical protein